MWQILKCDTNNDVATQCWATTVARVDCSIYLNRHEMAGSMHILRHLDAANNATRYRCVISTCWVPNHKHLLLHGNSNQ